jgi:hypothetical protein
VPKTEAVLKESRISLVIAGLPLNKLRLNFGRANVVMPRGLETKSGNTQQNVVNWPAISHPPSEKVARHRVV